MTTRNQDGDPKMPNFQEQLKSAPIGTKHLRTREPIRDEENKISPGPIEIPTDKTRTIEESENSGTDTLQNKT